MSRNENGYKFEKDTEKDFSGRRTIGSGNRWFDRMDVGTRKILLSCKETGHNSFRITQDDLQEAIDAVEGPGGAGGEIIPGWAIRINNNDYILLRKEDLIRMVKEEATFIPETKSETKRRVAQIPILQRENE